MKLIAHAMDRAEVKEGEALPTESEAVFGFQVPGGKIQIHISGHLPITPDPQVPASKILKDAAAELERCGM